MKTALRGPQRRLVFAVVILISVSWRAWRPFGKLRTGLAADFSRVSLLLDADFLNELGVLGDLGLDEGSQLLRRAGCGVHAEGGEGLLDVGVTQDARQLGVELRHDRLRHAGRPENAPPAGHHEA